MSQSLAALLSFGQTCAPWTARSHPKQRHFFTWLVILWLAFRADPLKASAGRPSSGQTTHGLPEVNVRMSTSIVESANYQPEETIPALRHQDQSEKESSPVSERGSRTFRSQDPLAAKSDNSDPWTRQHVRAPIIFNQHGMTANQHPASYQFVPHSNYGKILDSASNGHRWSVSTSRNLSPAAIQVQNQASAANRAPTGHTPIKTPTPSEDNPTEQSVRQRGFIRRILDGGHQTLLDLRCEGRGVGKMLKSAKNMLQDRVANIEEHSGLLVLGSSLLAATIPLAVLYSNAAGGEPALTSNRRAGPPANPAPGNEGRLAFVRYMSLQSGVDSMMGWIERSVEHLPNFPRLHPQECVKRSICEAHNEPNKYGAIGFVLRLLFPATNLSSTDRMDNMEYKVINKYRHAAGYGLNRRIESNGTNASACREKYEDCLVSLLDVARNMMDVFLR